MKMAEAVGIMQNVPRTVCDKGFMVCFEHVQGGMLAGDYFPDKHAGETLIASEEDAWDLAVKFAGATVGKCVNVYVIGANFVPVSGYQLRRIENRK